MMNTLKKILIVPTIFALISNCSEPIAPVVPQWETQMNIPIATQNYSLDELMHLSSNLSISERQDILDSKMVILTNRPIANTIRLDYSTDNKRVIDNIVSGELVMQTDNRLPSNILLTAQFLDKDANVLFTPKSVDNVTAFIPARSADNQIQSPQRVVTRIILTPDEAKKVFMSEYLHYELILTTPNGGSAKFYANDYIDIRASASIVVHSNMITK